MGSLTLDSETLNRLLSAGPMVQLKDSDGHVCGFFLLAEHQLTPAQRDPKISEEELDRREAAGGGRPLAEIFDDWKRRP